MLLFVFPLYPDQQNTTKIMIVTFVYLLIIIFHCIFVLIVNAVIVTSFILPIDNIFNIIIPCYFKQAEKIPLSPN